jgi:hypothetical protein
MNEVAKQVAEWLRGIDSITEVVPVVVTIGNNSWEGARYVQRGDIHLYLVGDMPKSYQRSSHEAYPHNDLLWYISGWWKGMDARSTITAVQAKEYHPFGKMFMLMPWTCDLPIDYGEEPYRRVPMTIQEIK